MIYHLKIFCRRDSNDVTKFQKKTSFEKNGLKFVVFRLIYTTYSENNLVNCSLRLEKPTIFNGNQFRNKFGLSLARKSF